MHVRNGKERFSTFSAISSMSNLGDTLQHHDCFFSSADGCSVDSDGAIFYDAVDGDEDDDKDILSLTDDFHQLSINYTNIPSFSSTSFISTSGSRITSASSSLPLALQPGFYKGVPQNSVQNTSNISKKMTYPLEIYKNSKVSIPKNVQIEDSREEINLSSSSARSSSAYSIDGVGTFTSQNILDREAGNIHPFDREPTFFTKTVATRNSLSRQQPSSSSGNPLCDNSSQNTSPAVEGFLISEKNSDTDLGDVYSVKDENNGKSDARISAMTCSSANEGLKKQRDTTILPPSKTTPSESIFNKQLCMTYSEHHERIRKNEDQIPTEMQAKSRKKVLRSEYPAVPGRVKSAGGSNFVMTLITSKKHAHKGPIWVMKFSLCGKYLATAGKSGIIYIWRVLPENQLCNPPNLNPAAEDTLQQSKKVLPNVTGVGKVLSDEPMQRLEEHNGHHIVDLSWSKCGFILSASLDKTVRLWHVSRSKSLRVFHHADYVTSVDFNPCDDQYFLSGGFDKKIRIWSITTKRVKEWAQTPDIITAAKYSPDGKLAIAGMMKGQVYFYCAQQGLRYFTQISCRNRHGPKRDGRKVTGLHFRRISGEETLTATLSDEGNEIRSNRNGRHGRRETGNRKWASRGRMLMSPIRFFRSKSTASRLSDQLLVTTNDGRIRLFGLGDFCLLKKFKGSKLPNMQICASFSGSGQNIVCGSEDGRTYIWESNMARDLKVILQKFVSHKQYDRSKYCARFHACEAASLVPSVVTEAIFVPEEISKEAVVGSEMSSLLTSYQDWSSAMIVTSDYEGNIKVFAQKKCLELVAGSAG